MQNRILELSEQGARLNARLGQLIIRLADEREVSIPFDDLAVIVTAHPQVSLTQAVLAELSQRGGVLVSCDSKRLPTAMLLPIHGHHLQTTRFAIQASASLPLKKRLWQQIIRSKIAAQANLLLDIHKDDFGLLALIPLVRSGDPDNVEARAARKYWNVLFGSNTFRRDPDLQDQNRLLNYGYAVLRAMTSRSICAAGMHPSLGIHHHNKYNTFCLADDLMEPYRPVVDRAVANFVAENGYECDFNGAAKQLLLEGLTGCCRIGGQERTIFDALSLTSQSLVAAFVGDGDRLALPENLDHAAA